MWTWKSPGDCVRNQIDFVIIRKRFRNAVKNAKTAPGADCNSDHVPVVCQVRVNLKKITKKRKYPKLDINLLRTDPDMKSRYNIAVKNRFEALQTYENVDSLWQHMKNSIIEVAEEFIPSKQIDCKRKWMTKEILDLMETRRKSKHNDIEYSRLNKKIKKKCNEAKESFLNNQCKEIESKWNKNSKFVHEKIKEATGKSFCTRSGCIKAKDGSIIMEKERILDRWSEYIKDLFEDDRGNKPVIKKNFDGPPILRAEVQNAIKTMKRGKAVGPDNISIEMIESLEDFGMDMVTMLMNEIYENGDIPEDLCKSIFIALPKKPGATECELHRTISLMSQITKILLKILTGRIRNKLRPEIAEEQNGFVEDKGTRNAIFCLSTLIERSMQVQRNLYLCFIDYSKAFDCVKHRDLFSILHNLNIEGKDLRIIRNLYWDQKAAMRVEGELSPFTEIKRGVRQGCVMSPDLFNIYSEMILREISDIEGIRVGGYNMNNLRYADDTVLISDSQEGLQALIDKVGTESEKKGLLLNVKKTECMLITKKSNNTIIDLKYKGMSIKQVHKFKYLGCEITSDGRWHTEIIKRIALAKNTFRKMSPLLTNNSISWETKSRVLRCYVWSTLLYGSECWTITKELQNKLEAAEMWFWRRILKISWTHKVSNKDVLIRAKTQRTLMETIRKKQLEFLGHLCRKKGLEHQLLTGKIEGKRDRGRQRTTYMDSLKLLTNEKNAGTLLQKTDDRENWKTLIVNVCNQIRHNN